MAKKPTVSFVCQECGYDSPQWLGKCPECGAWNSLKEFREAKSVARSAQGSASGEFASPKKLSEIESTETKRRTTGFREFDTVLGGGLVPGAVMLLAGDPGVGKSTLLLQLALRLSSNKVVLSKAKDPLTKKTKVDGEILLRQPADQNDNPKILYISGEESAEQVKMRASRLIAASLKKIVPEDLLILSTTNSDHVVNQIENTKPAFVVVDSIQTMQSEQVAGLAGSIPQIRFTTMRLVEVAKRLHIPIVLVGHVTKEGMVAGPMMLSHMVDTVLFLEGEKFSSTRILRSLKNRFGPVDEVGVFAMQGGGLEEVTDPSQLFLSNYQKEQPGSVLVVTMEGTRAFLVELQALVVSSRLPLPRRVASGVDPKRLELLLAVLQKHCHLPLDTTDVFVNVAGGLKLSDPGIDLGICLAIFASMKNVPLSKTVGIAEVGLLGELRKVAGEASRVKEAKQFGFTTVLTASSTPTLRDVLSLLGKKKG